MVTRLESGRMQLNAPGGVPMERVVPQQVDYMPAAREQARGAGVMADIIDRMSQSIFAFGKELAAEEAVRYVADNPPDRQQLLIAAGFDEASGQFVKASEDKNKGAPIPITAFDKAYRKARAEQIAGLLKAEGLNQIANFLTRLDKEGVDKLSSEQISKQIESMISGFEAAARKESPEAAIQVRASLAANGYTAIEKARQLELKAAQSKRLTIFDEKYQSHIRLLEADVDRGFSIDQKTGEKMLIDDMAKLRRVEILNEAIALNDPGLQKEYGAKFDTALRNAKISAVTRFILTNEKLLDNPMLGRMIMTGQLDKMSDVMTDLLNNDMKAVAEINANVDIALNRQVNLKKKQAEEGKQQAWSAVLPKVMEFMRLAESDPRRKTIASDIAAVALNNPEVLSMDQLKYFLEPPKNIEGDARLKFSVATRIFKNEITQPEQIAAYFEKGLSPEQGMSLLNSLISKQDKDNQRLYAALANRAGIDVNNADLAVINARPNQFKRLEGFEKEAEEIKSEAIRQGKPVPSPTEILKIIDERLETQINSNTAKSAKDSLKNVYGTKEWTNPGKDQAYRDKNPVIIYPKNYPYLEWLVKKEQDQAKKKRMQQDLDNIKRLLQQAYPGEM